MKPEDPNFNFPPEWGKTDIPFINLEERISKLEQENAALRAERDELSRTIEDAHHTAMIDWPGSEVSLLAQVESLFSALKNHYNDKAEGLAGALEGYANMTRLEPPADWNCFKAGGLPEISDYTEEDIGGPARDAIDSYRAACPWEGQTSNPSNSPTASREIQG